MAEDKKENFELADENLETLSGGQAGGKAGGMAGLKDCKKCGSSNVTDRMGYSGPAVLVRYSCQDCGYTWEETLI